jgi:hypothetical protein
MNNIAGGLHKGILWIFLACASTACVKDKGNYQYRDLNTVTIAGILEGYATDLGGRLKITPELTFSVSESHDSMKYEWHVLNDQGKSMGTLSTERNIDAEVGKPITKDGIYTMLYCVTNLSTGIMYYYRFNLVVRNRMLNGYIMLCERENESFDIELISVYNDTLTQYHNMLDLYDSRLPRAGRKPVDLVCYCDPASPTLESDGKKNYAIWILTDKSTDRVRVEDFEWRPEFNISALSMIPDKYMNGKTLVAEKMHAPVTNANNNAINYIRFDGNWHWYNWPSKTYFYLSPINSAVTGGKPYKSSPYICSSATRTAVVFNEDENRFEYQNSNASGNSQATLHTNRLGADQTFFNWENPDYRLVYMGNIDLSRGFAVVKNAASGKYELLTMNLSTLNNPPKKEGQAVFPPLPEGLSMDDIRFFVPHGKLPYIFLATDDKVFMTNYNTMTGWRDVTATLVPAGHRISRMKNTAIRFSDGARILVATYDPAGAAGKNGQLTLYDVNDGTGAVTLARHPKTASEGSYQIDMKWTGFGKIVGVDYREPK